MANILIYIHFNNKHLITSHYVEICEYILEIDVTMRHQLSSTNSSLLKLLTKISIVYI